MCNLVLPHPSDNSTKNPKSDRQPVKLLTYKVYNGYNIYHESTVVCQSFDLGEFVDYSIQQAGGTKFAESYLNRFSSLQSFVANTGLNEKFIEKLKSNKDVSFSEILLEAILAVETSITFARHELTTTSFAAIEQNGNNTDLVWSSSLPELSQTSAIIALTGICELLPNKCTAKENNTFTLSFEMVYKKLWDEARKTSLAPSISAIKHVASSRGIPCEIQGRQCLQLGQGKFTKQIDISMSSPISALAQNFCTDKQQSNICLTESDLPATLQLKVSTTEAVVNAAELLNKLYPPDNNSGGNGRIPIVVVTGDNGTGTAAKMLDMILRGADRSIALSLRAQSYIDGHSVTLSEDQKKHATQVLLRHPELDALVTTLSLRETAKTGMVLDSCSITVIIDRVKQGEAEHFYNGLDIIVRATSHCFIIAAGNIAARSQIKELGNRRLILVAERMNDPELQKHINAGYDAVTTIWHEGQVRVALFSNKQVVATIPFDITRISNGLVKKWRLKNAILFATAAAFGLGLSGAEIQASIENSPGIITDEI